MSQLSDYIKKELDKGFSVNKIKAKLVEAGYDPKTVEEEIKKVKDEHGEFEEKKFGKFIKKNKIPGALAALLLLIIIIIAVFFIVPNKQEKLLKECEGIADANGKNVCILKAAAELDSTELCSGITTEANDIVYYACVDKYWLRDDCSYEEIIGEEDECRFEKVISVDDINEFNYELSIFLCNSINGQEIKSRCFDYINQKEKEIIEAGRLDLCKTNDCIVGIALENKNCSIVESEDFFDYCLLNLAIKEKDIIFCNMIINSNIKEKCKWGFYSEEEFLNALSFLKTEFEKLDYIYENVQLSRNIQRCKYLKNIDLAEFSKEDTFENYTERRDISSLNEIDLVGSCELAASAAFGVSCDGIRNEAYTNLCKRFSSGDVAFCSGLEEDMKEFCTSEIEESNCKAFDGEETRFLCVLINDFISAST